MLPKPARAKPAPGVRAALLPPACSLSSELGCLRLPKPSARKRNELLGSDEAVLQFVGRRQVLLPGGDAPTSSIAAADVDGDGDLDVLLGNDGSPSRVLLNAGDGTFPTSIELPGGSTSTLSIAAADVDGDGDLDVLLGNDGRPSRVLLNAGDGTFPTSIELPGGSTSTLSFAAADVDGDGDLDLLLGNDGESQVLLNAGDGTFPTSIELPGGSAYTRSIAAADVDADGDLDLLLGNNGSPSRVLLNAGDGTFPTSMELPGGSASTLSIAAADVDGDGDLDVLLGNYGGSSRVLLNAGDGTFPTSIELPGGSASTLSVAAADVDGDGDLDVLLGNYGGSSRVLLNAGDGTFPTSIELPGSGAPTCSIAAADVDGDGDLDVLLGNYGSSSRVLLIAVDGTFPTSIELPGGGASTRSIAAADVDADGDLDLLLGNYGSSRVLLNAGDGTFPTSIELPGGSASTLSIAAADVDGDGDLDVLLGNYGSSRVLLNAGDGTFPTSIELPGGSAYTRSIAAADVDGDGDLDVLLGNTDSPSRVLLNAGDGTFPTSIELPGSGASTWSIAAADVDGDGDLDVLLGNYGGSSRVLLNAGDGTFPTSIELPGGGASTSSIAAADVDGDGDLDVLLGNTDSPSRVLLNTGDGTFPTSIELPGGSAYTRSIAAADVDGDGDLDVLLGNYGSSSRVLLNAGDGTFPTSIELPGGSASTWSIAAADVDGDGDLDLEVVDFSTLTMGRRIGQGGFATVWIARWQGNDLAIKVLNVENENVKTSTAHQEVAMLQEVAILRRLRHPCICHLFGYIQVDHRPALVLEYMAGGSLAAYLFNPRSSPDGVQAGVSSLLSGARFYRNLIRTLNAASAPIAPQASHGRQLMEPPPQPQPASVLPCDKKIRFGVQLASGLCFLHSHGILHSDVKTDNALLDVSHTVCKLSDFGLASLSVNYARDRNKEYKATVGGTLRYLAPERVAEASRRNARENPDRGDGSGGISGSLSLGRALVNFEDRDTWTVRALDADAAEPRRVQRLEVRLPLTSAPTIGTSLALAPGASLHVLRGLWVPCTILDESPVLGQRIRLRAPSSIEAWVSGSSLVHPDLNAQGEAEPPPPVQPGGVALALPAPESPEQHAAEVVFEELRPDGMALVSDAVGGVRTIPANLLRPRYMPNFRVLVATGGFQRATLEAVGADSTLSVALCGGGRRWVSAAEVLHGACVMRTIPADVCSEALVAVGDVGSDPSPPLDLGDSVYVLIGAWREAIVESQQGDYYLVHEGGGVRRWASAGELAWHDVPPQPFDLTAGKAVIAWDARVGAYQAAVMAQQESVHGEGGGTWVVRFDCGHEASVVVGALRERWHVPVRVLCLWGNYYPATVLEALAGLLRVDFGGGHVQWALPEQTLSSHAPSAADLVIGAYVGAVRPSADPAAAAVPEAKRRYHRGSVVQLDGESRVVEVRFEDGSMHAVPLEQLQRSFRKLKEEKAKDAELEALIQTAETEAAPPKPDREAQAKLRESLQKRQADLKATHSKTTQPNHAFRDAQDEKSKVQIEIAELRRQVDTGNSEARLLTKQVEHTRKVLEMEERAGSAEKAEKMYEEYSSRLAESARREAEKQKAEQDKLDRYNDDGSLGEGPPCMQAAAAVSHEIDDAAGGAGGGFAAMAAMVAAQNARLATGIVEKVSKNDEKLKAIRQRLQELDMADAEAMSKVQLAEEKITAHHSLTAHRAAAGSSSQAGAATPQKKSNSNEAKRSAKAAAATPKAPSLPDVVDVNSLRAARRPRAQAGEQGVADSPTVATLRARLMLAAAEDEADD
ncbi:protein kinase [Chrysochromulina tobinii]|uniref:Protein kinase n=1 Tax=Chrysochromulina tobinii TaxID=1460289 RepID=A0A0M0K447_9EUKA|nr:protein kinase [Chrysochromulina tobinii]|eukprot:KOO33148.1 protein kinase [Chrysochromulina sp. CCMP291]